MSTSKIIFLSLSIFFAGGSEEDTSLLKEPWNFYYKRGMLQYRAEMYDFSIESLKMAMRKKPDLYQAANTLAKIYLLKSRQTDALETFLLSLRIKENQPEILCEAALLHEFFAQYDAAFDKLKKALTQNALHVKSHANIIRFYDRRNNMPMARHHLQKSIELGKKRGAVYFRKARRAEKAGKYHLALNLYRRSLKESPAWIDAHLRIYEINRMKKNFPRAVKRLEKLVRMVPFHEKAHIYLGHLYFTKKISKYRKYNIHRALTHLQKAAKLAPENPDIFHLLSDIYLFTGDDVKGEEMEKKAFKLEENQEAGRR